MADVEVDISQAQVTLVLNAPGGLVNDWMRETIAGIEAAAIANSPINDVLNAMHRGGVVGTYKASWRSPAITNGSNSVSGTVENTAGHAIFVEEGRDHVVGQQRFSWRNFKPPGSIHVVQNSAGYPRQRVLYYATQDVLEAQTDYYVAWP